MLAALCLLLCATAPYPRTWQCLCLCFSGVIDAPQLACRLDAESWRWAPSIKKIRMGSLLPQPRLSSWPHFASSLRLFWNEAPACLSMSLPHVFSEALTVVSAEQFLMVIGGSLSGQSPKAPVAAMVFTTLWSCRGFVGSMLACQEFASVLCPLSDPLC